jgi:hypothetical protein
VRGHPFGDMWLGRGFGAKDLKLSGCGSVLGVLCQLATGDNGVWCWVEVCEMELVMVVSARKHMEGGLGPKTQN